MNKVRVIPRLDIKGPNLVKGIHLEGLRVLGSPDYFSTKYYENGADEIFYVDCVASLYERNSLGDIISRTAKDKFIPLTVGGGLRSAGDIRNVLNNGADKISLNTAAVKRPEFIREVSRIFGSSTIVVSVEAIKQDNGEYLAFVDNGREETGLSVTEWAQEVVGLGAGEIVITSVDREGTSEGFDRKLIKNIVSNVNVPVVAHGGCSTVEDTCDTIIETGVDAVCIASSLHYGLIASETDSREFQGGTEGNTRFLNSGSSFKKVKTFTIQELKEEMVKRDIPCRME